MRIVKWKMKINFYRINTLFVNNRYLSLNGKQKFKGYFNGIPPFFPYN